MEDLYLTKYAVKGIKSLDKRVELSFYKKTYDDKMDISGYNVKAIYGVNGSGKTGLMTSMKIFKGLLLNPYYLSNPLVQRNLSNLVNKKTRTIEFDIEYYFCLEEKAELYRYQITIEENAIGKFQIKKEILSAQGAKTHSNKKRIIYSVEDGEFNILASDKAISTSIEEKTRNLLSYASFLAIYAERIGFTKGKKLIDDEFNKSVVSLFLFGNCIYVYMDSEDEHTDYVENELITQANNTMIREQISELKRIANFVFDFQLLPLSIDSMSVRNNDYKIFEKQIMGLQNFISIFKPELVSIDIDKRENKDRFECRLLFNYGEYRIDAEYESTGIKKLIKLYPYLLKVVNGDVVFVDELDSNLHDVYLCALLEYLMQYGKGQMCFTTHNIGPMDVLKNNKKSIDFLSSDHSIKSWTANGHYSPSRLYKNGMIEGSPFNVDSIDFIGTFYEE